MEATVKFNLPEERIEFDDFMNGTMWQLVLWDLHNWLRDNYKYDKGDIPLEIADKVNDKLFEIMNEYNLKFN